MSNWHINIISAFIQIGSCIQLSYGPWNVGSTHSKACNICEFSMSSIFHSLYIGSRILTRSLFTGHHGCFWWQKCLRAALLGDARLRSPRVKQSQIMSRDNFQLRQTQNVDTTNIFRPYSYRAWILEGFFNPVFFYPKNTHTWKWKLQFGGNFYLWDHQAGTSSNAKYKFLKSNWNLKVRWDSEWVPPHKTYRQGVTISHHLIKSLVFLSEKPAVPISINHFY